MSRAILDDMTKWLFRANARYKMEFGVEGPAIKSMSPNGGESKRRFLSSEAAKSMARSNLDCLRSMNTDRFKEFTAKRRERMETYYRECYPHRFKALAGQP